MLKYKNEKDCDEKAKIISMAMAKKYNNDFKTYYSILTIFWICFVHPTFVSCMNIRIIKDNSTGYQNDKSSNTNENQP